MIEALFWDNDGVLVQTEHLYMQASREILAGCGIELTDEQFRDISLNKGQSLIDLAGQVPGLGQTDLDRLKKSRNDRYADLIDENHLLIDGVKETLDELAGRYPMAIVTSSLGQHFHRIHAELGLLRYFDFSLVREDYDKSKPHPEPYLLAAEMLDVPPSASLVIEDSRRGLQAGNAAGMKTLVIPNELTATQDLSLADYRLDNVTELPEFMKKNMHWS